MAPLPDPRRAARHASCFAAFLLALALGACGGDPAAAVEKPKGGLVILPPDPSEVGPLPDNILPRDNFHYFGEVPNGETVEHEFHLLNTSDVPVRITKVSPGCGCLVPRISYTKEDGEVVRAESNRSGVETLLEVPPGMEADLLVRVDTKTISRKNEHKTITTRLTTDSEATPFLSLEVSILPRAPFQVNPAALKFGRVPMSAGGEMSVDVVPVDESGAQIAGVEAVPEGVEAQLEEGSILGTRIWVLTARYLPPLAAGPHRGTVVLSTVTANGAPGPSLEVAISCTAVEDVQVDTRLVLVLRGLGTDPQEARSEVYSLLSGHRLRLLSAEVEEAHREDLLLQFEPRDPDGEGRSERWILRLSTRRPLPKGVLVGKAILTLDDPQTPRVDVSYAVHVER